MTIKPTGLFDRPGEFDESSFWNLLRSPEQRAEDQAIKARRAASSFAAAGADSGQTTATLAARVAALEAHAAATETRVLGLALYARTLASLLLKHEVFTQAEFEARMREIDALDGVVDGR